MALKRGVRKPEIILGRNADVSFLKAASLLGIRVCHIPTDASHRLDLGAVKRAVSRETCLVLYICIC